MTDVESAYYFFLKTHVSYDASYLSLLKLYEPILLEDMEPLISSKLDLIEAFLRQFDLLHSFEQSVQASHQAKKGLIRDISLAK